MCPMLPRQSVAWGGQVPFPALPLTLECSGDCFGEKNKYFEPAINIID